MKKSLKKEKSPKVGLYESTDDHSLKPNSSVGKVHFLHELVQR